MVRISATTKAILDARGSMLGISNEYGSRAKSARNAAHWMAGGGFEGKEAQFQARATGLWQLSDDIRRAAMELGVEDASTCENGVELPQDERKPEKRRSTPEGLRGLERT